MKLIILIIICLLCIVIFTCFKTEHFETTTDKNIHFILLKSNSSRVKHVNRLIKDNNLNATLFDAINGNNKHIIDKYQKMGYITGNVRNTMRSGAVGCALSHILLLEQFIKSGKPYMTVFEDDVEFTKDFKEKYDNFLNHLPPDVDFSQLLHSNYTYEISDFTPYSIPNNDFVLKGYPQSDTVGCFFTRKGAIKILKLIKPMTTTVDDMFAKLIKTNKIISYVPKKQLIKMNYKFESNIVPGQFMYG
jgi:glycosyl transferase family 25